MNITEKVAYIKGLMEGLELDERDPNTKVLLSVVDLLDDIALEINDIGEDLDELVEEVGEIDEDLGALEDDFYDDEEDDDDTFYEVTCPKCKEVVCLSEDILLDGKMLCPNCKEELEFDIDCDCTDGACSIKGCDCGCQDTLTEEGSN